MEALAKLDLVGVVFALAAITLLQLALRPSKARVLRLLSESCDSARWVLAVFFLLIRPFGAQAFYIPSPSMVPTLGIGDRLLVDKLSYRLNDPQRGDVIVFAAPARATDDNKEGTDFIKRCIGLPGETVEVRGARLRVGGETIGPENTDPRVHPAADYLRQHLELAADTPVRLTREGAFVNHSWLSRKTLARKLGVAESALVLEPGEVRINGKPLDEPYVSEDPGYDMPVTQLPAGYYFMMGDNRNNSADSHYWGLLERERMVGVARLTYFPLGRVRKLP